MTHYSGGVNLVVLSAVLQLASVAAFVFVAAHAFKRSLGTGFMVLCLPVYNIVYGFTQFEHRAKGLILAVWLGGFVLGLVARGLGVSLGAEHLPLPSAAPTPLPDF